MMTKKSPQLRFEGFTDDWEQRKLESLCEVFTDGDWIEAKDQSNSGVRLIQTGNIGITEYLDKENNKKWISEETLKRLRCEEVYPGDILISRLPDPAGRACILPNLGIRMITAVDCTIIRTSKEYDSKYLVQYLSTPTYFKIVNSFLGGGTRQRISRKNLSKIDIPVPHIFAEQQKIGEYFSNLDHLITLHQHKLDLLKEQKKGFLQKMFPKNGAKVPELRFAGFTDAWEERKIKDIFKITRGQVLAATETSEEKSDISPFPVYSSQTKNNGLMGYYKDYLFDTAITWTTDGANAGTVSYRSGKFYSTNVNGVLISDKGYTNKAISEILNLEAWKWVSHVGNPKLMNNVMGDISIMIPSSFEEQDRLSDFLNQLDDTIALHQRKLDLLKEQKKGFLQKMFV